MVKEFSLFDKYGQKVRKYPNWPTKRSWPSN